MSLKTRVLTYLKRVYYTDPNVWIHKGEMERIVKAAGYLAETGNREIRKLKEENKIDKKEIGKSYKVQYLPDMVDIANNIDKLV